MPTVCCVYAHAGWLMGNRAPLLDEETKARCQKAIGIYRRNTEQTIILIATSYGSGEHSLGKLIREYLIACEVRPDHIYADAFGKNTDQETEGFICLIRRHCGNSAEVIAVSSYYHIPRIYFIWRSQGWKIKLTASWRSIDLLDLLLEPLKLLVVIFGSAQR